MRRGLLEILACPNCCADPLTLEEGQADGEAIAQGRLECPRCGRGYPIITGVPRLMAEVARVSKPNALLAIEQPRLPKPRLWQRGAIAWHVHHLASLLAGKPNPRHPRLHWDWSLERIQGLLGRAGFRLERWHEVSPDSYVICGRLVRSWD